MLDYVVCGGGLDIGIQRKRSKAFQKQSPFFFPFAWLRFNAFRGDIHGSS